MSENAPSFQSALASVLVNAVKIVQTTTVVLVLDVIFAIPLLKLINLPTSVVRNPSPPFIPVTADAVKLTLVPTAA